MKRVALYFWSMASETPPGRRITTKHRMPEDVALAQDPTATPVGEPKWVDVPETEAEERENLFGNAPGTKTQRG
jgi:hypothetical protein